MIRTFATATKYVLLGVLLLAGVMLPAACESAKPQQKATPGLEKGAAGQAEEPLKPLPAKALLTLEQLPPKLAKPLDKEYQRPLPVGAQQALEEGMELRKEGNLAKAIEKFERAKGFDPNNPTVAKQLGLTYAKLPNYGKAEGNLKIAAEYFGNDADMQVLLGRIDVMMKRPQPGQLRFRLALLCDNATPENKNAAHALLFLGRMLEQEGYWAAALECFTTLEKWTRRQSGLYQEDAILRNIVMKPEDLMATRGRLLALLRRNDQAVQVLRRAYRRNRSDSATAQLLVGALVAAGKFNQAEKLLVELAGQPVHGTIVPILASRLCVKSGDQTMPGRIVKAYRAKNAVSPEMALSLARAAMLLKAPKEAEEILQDLLREVPDNAQAAAMLAAISAKQGKYDQALRLLAELVAKNPQSTDAVRIGVREILTSTPKPPADLLESFSQSSYKDTSENKYALHYVAGVLAEFSGKELLAADHFKRAIEENKDFHPAYEALLALQLQAGADTEVNAILEDIKKQAKQGYYYYYLLGKARLQQGDVMQAIDAFDTADEKNPSYLPTILELARAYRQAAERGLGRSQSRNRRYFQKSQEMYAKALELDPKRVSIYREAFDQAVAGRDMQSAKEIAQGLLEQLPKSPDGLILVAELYILEQNFKQANFILRQLASQFPNRVEIPLLAIRADVSRFPGVLPKSVYERSVKRLQTVLEKFPGNLQARRMLAGLYGRPVPGEFEKAVKIWKELHEQFPRDELFTRTYLAALLQSKKYAPAKPLLDELLKKHPGDSNLRRMLLDVLVQTDRTNEAINLAKLWWDKSGRTAAGQGGFEWLGFLLDLYAKDGQYDKAIQLLDELLKSKTGPSSEALEGKKITLLVKDGRYDDAAKIALESKEAFPAMKLAYDDITEKKYARAIELLDKRIKVIKGRISAEQLTRKQSQPETATTQPESQPAETQPAAATKPAELQKVQSIPLPKSKAELDAEEELKSLRQLKVMAQIKLNPTKIAPALEWANEQLKDNPTDKGPRQLLIGTLMESDHYDVALNLVEGWIKEIAQAKPRLLGSTAALLWLRETEANLLLAAGKPKQALARCEELIPKNPNYAELYNIQASALGELGETEESLKSLRRAQSLQPDSPSLCNNLAYSLAVAGQDLPFAEKLIQSCLKQVGKYMQIPDAYLDTKAWVLYKQGRFSQAGGIFLRILPQETADGSDGQTHSAADHPVLWDHAGDVFYRLGWKDRALVYWKNALAKAKKEEKQTRELQTVLDTVPAKITAAEAGQKVQTAPLSNKIEEQIKELRNKTDKSAETQPADDSETPEMQESE